MSIQGTKVAKNLIIKAEHVVKLNIFIKVSHPKWINGLIVLNSKIIHDLTKVTSKSRLSTEYVKP